MKINAIQEINLGLDELDAKIKHLESSPNRAFVLIEYDTLFSFHWFNLCFKQFWDEFDRHSASQLLQYQIITKRFSELCGRYVALFREQLDYLESVIDFEDKSINELPPVVFSEDDCTDVIGYYKESLKNETDDNNNPLYSIELDSNSNSEVVDGKKRLINYYMFRSDKINDCHYNGLAGMYRCLKSIFDLMCVVCSYPDELIYDYKPSQEDIITALENELRQYAREIGNRVELNLKNIAQGLKPVRNASLTTDVWGFVMQEEDELFDLAIHGKLEGSKDKRFDQIFMEERKMLTDNYSLLDKIKRTSIDEELFDIRLSVETYNLLSSLNSENLDLFYNRVLRRNIISRNMFPKELSAKYDEWVNSREEEQSEVIQTTELSVNRQSKLDEIIAFLKKGDWKHPATDDNVEMMLNSVFGRDVSLHDGNDGHDCEKLWALVESGSGDRMQIVPANLAGFFYEENLLIGGPKKISDDLFGKGSNQSNNINKGMSKNCSAAFRDIIPFLRKYIERIIRQV